MKYLITMIFTVYCALFVSSCQSRLLTVYKIDVQQGNAVEAKAVDKITLGMNREQVRFVLGSPLITDSFHPDRWDYIYLFTPGYGEEQRRQLTLIFDRGEVIDVIKHNIVADYSSELEQSDDDSEQEDQTVTEKTTEKQLEEQEKLEKQAEELEDILETNQNPIN